MRQSPRRDPEVNRPDHTPRLITGQTEGKHSARRTPEPAG